MFSAKKDTRARLRWVLSCSGRKETPGRVFDWCIHVQREKKCPGTCLIGAFVFRAKNDTRTRLRAVPFVFWAKKRYPCAFFEWCCHVWCICVCQSHAGCEKVHPSVFALVEVMFGAKNMPRRMCVCVCLFVCVCACQNPCPL